MTMSSRALKGIYRITDIDGNVYGVEMVPHGRRKMSGRISAKDLEISVFIAPKEFPTGLRLTISNYTLFGSWEDTTMLLLNVISADKHCPWVGQWERLKKEKESEWSVEIMWTREHHYDVRFPRQIRRAHSEFATMLRDLAPDNAFDPRNLWDPEEEARKAAQKAEKEKAEKKAKGKKKGKGGGSGGKKQKKGFSAAEIRKKNNTRMDGEAQANDLTRLTNARKFGAAAVAKLVLKTKAMQLQQIGVLLEMAVSSRNAVDTLDALWDAEGLLENLDDESKKKFMKGFKKPYEKALLWREDLAKMRKSCKLAKEPKNIVEFQLDFMYDRLPPLTLVNRGKFKLDDWQVRVLQNIDRGQSTVVSAPTSSGKTVLSTYLCTQKKTKGVLFVVPTEPLAIQVASMFSVLKDNVTKLHVFNGVGLVIPSRVFPPDKFTDATDIVVGTPNAMETILTSKRLKGFDFDFAVFDEIHNLNGEEGGALQRILLQIDCPVLALSATIKNAKQLASWMQKNEDTLPKKKDRRPRKVLLEVVRARFINLQRHVWNGETLEELHPCAALTRKQLLAEGFESGDLAFTARDVLKLYREMKKSYPKEHVKDVKPEKCFTKDPKERVTMEMVKEYEVKLKQRLLELAAEDKCPTETDELLEKFREGAKSVETARKAGAAGEDTGGSVYPVAMDLKAKKMVPAVLFQFDASKCRRQFATIVETFEEKEKKEFPHLAKDRAKEYAKFEARLTLWQRECEQARKNNEPEPSQPEAPSLTGDDPVPKHTMFPPGRHLNQTEMQFIEGKFRQIAKKTKGKIVINNNHILMRGLRRGVGIYNVELPPSYLRVVQKFAQKGRLGVVFSDEALAYGVNMPFRTSAFIGDPGPELLDALLAQQASGRAGRRGMDRQGHLAYYGIKWERIQELMRGSLPQILGRETAYPTIALAQEVKTLSESAVSEVQLERVTSRTLRSFVEQKQPSGYVEQSKTWMQALNLSMLVQGSTTQCPGWRREMVWFMRGFPAESLLMEKLLDEMNTAFEMNDPNAVKYEDRFFYLCSRIMDRTTYEEGLKYQLGDEKRPPLSKCLPDDWAYWTNPIKDVQDTLAADALRVDNGSSTSDDYDALKSPMLLRGSATTELDSTTFLIFQRFGSLLNTLDSYERHWARQRFVRVGECIRVMHNTLRRSNEHPTLNYLTRRTFLRMRYVLFESFSDLFKTNAALSAGADLQSMSKLIGLEYDDEDLGEEEEAGGGEYDDAGADGATPAAPMATAEAPAAPVPVEEVTESVADLKVAESTTTNDDPDPYANLKKKKKKKKKKKEYVPDL
jgi:ATP-dependent RNA helicase DDX60